MQMAPEMQRLRAEHVALVTLSRFMMDIVGASSPPRPTEIASVRSMLRDTLVRHLKCEDWALYPRLRSTGDPELRELAHRFVGEMGHIAADFAAFDAKWTPARIDAEWTQFRSETNAILGALGARIEQEDRHLYPAIEALNLSPRCSESIAAPAVNGRGLSRA